MRVAITSTEHGDYVRVKLSRRNLLTLLKKLERSDSARTLTVDVPTSEGGGIRFFVTAEPDEVHYRDRVPGFTHPKDLPEGYSNHGDPNDYRY